MTMTRKQFLRSILGASVGVAGVAALAACGGGDDGGGTPTPDAPGATCTTPTNSIAGNHGHTLVVSLADVTAAASKTYDIMGSSAHTHSVILTPAHFATLAGGGTVTVTASSGGGHTHEVTVQCVS